MINMRDPWLQDLGRLTLGRREIVRTAVVVLLFTVLALGVKTLFGEVEAALIAMLGITIAGASGGLLASLFAAAIAFVVYNFFITEPELSFRIATGRDLAPLVIFNLCALVTGVLAGRLHDRSSAAEARNTQLRNLLELGRALQGSTDISDIAAALEQAEWLLGGRATLFQKSGSAFRQIGSVPESDALWQLARATMASKDAFTEVGDSIAVRLEGSDTPVGVVIVEALDGEKPDGAFSTAFANILALAVERAVLSERVAEGLAIARTEELKSALLSSVSHDFRTPLTAISASASSLLGYGDKLAPAVSQDLLRQMVADCDRLNRYTANLLEMSKLEAGALPTNLQWVSVAEMLGVVGHRARSRTRAHQIKFRSAETALGVYANPALFELVLSNVLENAIIYSPEGSHIDLRVWQDGFFCVISIADEGRGIPTEDLERVFDRFYRVQRPEASPRGSGLGLAIAKGFTEALGGTIEVRTPGIGMLGTEVLIRLPLAPEGPTI